MAFRLGPGEMGRRRCRDKGVASLLRRGRACPLVLQGVVSRRCRGVSVCWGRGASWAWGNPAGGGEGRAEAKSRCRAGLRGAGRSAWRSCGDPLVRGSPTPGYGAERGLRKSRVGVCRGQGWASGCADLREGGAGRGDGASRNSAVKGRRWEGGLVGLGSQPGTSPSPLSSSHGLAFFPCVVEKRRREQAVRGACPVPASGRPGAGALPRVTRS